MRQLVLAILVLISCYAVAQSPESVVQRFVDALNKKDLDSAAKCINGGQVRPILLEQFAKDKLPEIKISDVKASIIDDLALVTFVLHSEARGVNPAMPDYLVLAKVGPNWLIDVSENRGGLGMMAYLLSSSPILAQAQASAQTTKCLTNVKRLATGLIMFVSDNDDVLKVTVANWIKKVLPYIDKNTDLFTCPDDVKGAMSYSINPNVAGVTSLSISNLTRTVLIYEGKDGKLNFRHNGKAAVAFIDGHCEMVTQERAKNLIWKPGSSKTGPENAKWSG